MKKSEVQLLVQEVLTESGLGRNLNKDIKFNPSLLFEEASSEVGTFVKQAQSAGLDFNDPKDQEKFAQSLLDTDFDLDKIDPNSISEIKIPILEGGGGIFGQVIGALENAELVEHIMHAIGASAATIAKVKKIIHKIQKIAGYPFKLIEKAIYHVARFFGADVEKARMWGTTGLTIVAIICLVYAVMYFPSIGAIISGGASIMAFVNVAYSLAKAGSALKSIWDKVKSGTAEHKDEIYTPADFFQDIESTLKEKAKTANLKFSKTPFDWIHSLEGFIKHLKRPKRYGFYKAFRQLGKVIKNGETREGHFTNIYNQLHGDKKATEIFQKIQAIVLPKTTSDTDYYGTNSSFNESKLISAIKSLKEENSHDREYIQLLSRMLDRLKSIDDTSNSSDVVKKLEDLDTSLDYIAGALTGKDPLDIGANQAYFGRLSSPKKSKK